MDKRVKVHVVSHVGEKSHNALFSSCTYVQSEVDDLKMLIEVP